jgi:hypothetical protein
MGHITSMESFHITLQGTESLTACYTSFILYTVVYSQRMGCIIDAASTEAANHHGYQKYCWFQGKIG